MIYDKLIRKRLFFVCIAICFYMTILLHFGYTEEVEKYIKEFFEKYLKIPVEQINYGKETVLLPQFIGYVEGTAEVKSGEDLYEVWWFLQEPPKICRYMSISYIGKREEYISTESIIAEEEIMERIKPILEYGVIWVDIETQQVIGASPYNMEK